jgi:hypothetical protein
VEKCCKIKRNVETVDNHRKIRAFFQRLLAA